VIETHDKIEVSDFDGLWDRGEIEESPLGSMVDNLNVIFHHGEVRTREGLTTDFDGLPATGVLNGSKKPDWVFYYDLNGDGATPRYLHVSAGTLYHSQNSLALLVVTAANPRYAALHAFGRVYILITGNGGNAGLYVFNPLLPFAGVRLAMGLAFPFAPVTAAEVGVGAGNIERGTHIYAVVFETDSGYMTSPGGWVLVNHVGTSNVNITAIPAGPAGTINRHVLATKSILNYNGDFLNREYFFIPNGIVPGNGGGAALMGATFFDADLQESADFTRNQLAVIPNLVGAGVPGITYYKNRQVVWNGDTIYVSNPGEPESFDNVDSIILIDSKKYGYITFIGELRGTLYIWTSTGVLATTDNGEAPNSWEVIQVDPLMGAPNGAVSCIYNKASNVIDYYIVANEFGVFKFTGVYEANLAYKIENLWKTNTFFVPTLLQPTQARYIEVNPYSHRIYLAWYNNTGLPFTKLLVCDFSDGMTPDAVTWAFWQFTAPSATDPNFCQWFFTERAMLKLGDAKTCGKFFLPQDALVAAEGFRLDEIFFNDGSTTRPINSHCDFYFNPNNGKVNHFAGCHIRAVGAGEMNALLSWMDDIRTANMRLITLGLAPGFTYPRQFNVVSEHLKFRPYVTSGSTTRRFSLRNLIIYFKALWTRTT
jgi:hypothetical protein